VNCEGMGGCLFYTSSLHGASWVSPVNVGIHVTDSDWSIVTNNTYVFYARYNEPSLTPSATSRCCSGMEYYGPVG